jgi:hypothetical protein
MDAPVASGTLAESRSGSWASIRKEAASSDCSLLPSTPSGRTTRTTLPNVAGSDVVVGHDSRDGDNQASRSAFTVWLRDSVVHSSSGVGPIRWPAWSPPICTNVSIDADHRPRSRCRLWLPGRGETSRLGPGRSRGCLCPEGVVTLTARWWLARALASARSRMHKSRAPIR